MSRCQMWHTQAGQPRDLNVAYSSRTTQRPYLSLGGTISKQWVRKRCNNASGKYIVEIHHETWSKIFFLFSSKTFPYTATHIHEHSSTHIAHIFTCMQGLVQGLQYFHFLFKLWEICLHKIACKWVQIAHASASMHTCISLALPTMTGESISVHYRHNRALWRAVSLTTVCYWTLMMLLMCCQFMKT